MLFRSGWCMMVYGVVDLINAIKIYRCRKAYEKAHILVESNSSEDVLHNEHIEDDITPTIQ